MNLYQQLKQENSLKFFVGSYTVIASCWNFNKKSFHRVCSVAHGSVVIGNQNVAGSSPAVIT